MCLLPGCLMNVCRIMTVPSCPNPNYGARAIDVCCLRMAYRLEFMLEKSLCAKQRFQLHKPGLGDGLMATLCKPCHDCVLFNCLGRK